MHSIDQVILNFDESSLNALNLFLGFVMFGVALNFNPKDLEIVTKKPRAFLVGIVCQFVLLPALACLIIKITQLPGSIALGLLLISSCPGGNLSNLFTSISEGNTALSVCMSGTSTMLSIIMTPFNLTLWGSFNESTAKILKEIHIDPVKTFITVLTILIAPLVIGLLVKIKYTWFANKFGKIFNALSFLSFLIFAGVAFANNYDHFINYIGMVFWPVFWTNLAGISIAFFIAKKFYLTQEDAQAISFEVGIQNAGFGLVLIFNFFGGIGGAAIVAAWWGIFHVLTGGSLALILLRFGKNLRYENKTMEILQ
ncbi:MAG: bile acid:sodium symporter family protein [Bacteriovoracaceae bacterium]|jgi:BASS family bile acid:Na+ symporter|nr:bile acid:sodium symporter family protein [Bacteriovoracaceae bacterium]